MLTDTACVSATAAVIFGGFDFNGSGDLTQDEMTILLRAVIVGAAKIDSNVMCVLHGAILRWCTHSLCHGALYTARGSQHASH